MTLRERILAVYRGETPDIVPYMLDLSHWFYQKHHLPWDLGTSYTEPEYALIDYHKSVGAGFYMPNLAAFTAWHFPADVRITTTREIRHGVPELTWHVATPVGEISRARIWHEQTYAWGISKWGIHTPADLRVFADAMSRADFAPHWDRYRAWDDYVGDSGVIYLPLGYSAIGHLLNYWMGVEGVIYAAMDWPDALHEAVDAVNTNLLRLVDLVCESPAPIIIMGDNIGSDVQPPSFWNEWSRPFYAAAISRLHAAGKYVAVHIDGKLRGALGMVAGVGADCADAVTPKPMGDLEPAECRADAGPDFILSGGVSPDLWLPGAPIERFTAAARAWLRLKETNARFIANAGDQVPPGADEARIHLLRDLVAEHGRY